jgi:hypothetical protein
MIPTDTNVMSWISHLWWAGVLIGTVLIIGTAIKNRRENRKKAKEAK